MVILLHPTNTEDTNIDIHHLKQRKKSKNRLVLHQSLVMPVGTAQYGLLLFSRWLTVKTDNYVKVNMAGITTELQSRCGDVIG